MKYFDQLFTNENEYFVYPRLCCDGRVVKASDSKSDGLSRVGSNPTRSAPFFSPSIILDKPCVTVNSALRKLYIYSLDVASIFHA